MDIKMFLEVFLVGLLSAISPGPDFAVVMRNSLGFGRRAGVASALGIGLALSVHVGYTVLGFALLLQHLPGLFRIIQLLGATYLVWLGQKAIRSRAVPESSTTEEADEAGVQKSFPEGFRDGFLCNLLNPKATLFFLSIFSQFLTPGTPSWVRWIYGGEIMIAVAGWFVFLSVMVSMPNFRKALQRYRHWVDRVLGLVLLYFGLRIIIEVLFLK